MFEPNFRLLDQQLGVGNRPLKWEAPSLVLNSGHPSPSLNPKSEFSSKPNSHWSFIWLVQIFCNYYALLYLGKIYKSRYIHNTHAVFLAHIICVCVSVCVSDYLQCHGHRIFQARILEWVAISYSRGSSWPRDRTHISCVSCIGRWYLYQLRHLGSLHISLKEA